MQPCLIINFVECTIRVDTKGVDCHMLSITACVFKITVPLCFSVVINLAIFYYITVLLHSLAVKQTQYCNSGKHHYPETPDWCSP